jgi:uncharacterized membrane protein
MTPLPDFRRNVVEPIECISRSWALVKDQYWLFVGICAIGILIGSAIPLGILMGPMMCGMYLSFFAKRRGQPVELGTLFKGFDFFGPSVVATLLHVIPILIIVIPAYLLFYVFFIISMTATSASGEPNPGAMLGLLGMFTLFWIVMFFVIIIISIGFTFVYPLIVDRKMPPLDAIKVSFKAALANFWRILLLMILTGVITVLGMLMCYVGAFLAFPVTYGALAIAYEQVFGLRDPNDAITNLPPPPPSF